MKRQEKIRWVWVVVSVAVAMAAICGAGIAVAASAGGEEAPIYIIAKAVAPPSESSVNYGDSITYTVVLFGLRNTSVHLYDPLDRGLSWQGFVTAPPDVHFNAADHAVTGTVTFSPTTQVTVTFQVRVGVGAPGDIRAGWSAITNTAYFYFPDETLGMAVASNVVTTRVFRMAYIYLPLVIRDYPPNQPPYMPGNPTPADGATGQATDVSLSWSGGDPEGEVVTYDVYFEADDSTPDVVVCQQTTAMACAPGTLTYATHYYWQVVATDVRGATTVGPVWSFTTLAQPVAGWLAYVNMYRSRAGLPAVTENATWSNGCWLHSRYMVKNDEITHYEDPAKPWYTQEGYDAGRSGNVMVSSNVQASDEYAIDLWMKGPFHAVGILDPALHQVGFGSYREAIGTWKMGATLDVIRGLDTIPSDVTFPVRWPENGTTMPLLAYSGGETPDPLTSCPGYTVPSGPPIILQLGAGNITPAVTAHAFRQGAMDLEHCVFDETNYVNPTNQSVGRAVLNSRDAVVLMPRSPLSPGTAYTVSITANGQTYTWSFVTAAGARVQQMTPEALIR